MSEVPERVKLRLGAHLGVAGESIQWFRALAFLVAIVAAGVAEHLVLYWNVAGAVFTTRFVISEIRWSFIFWVSVAGVLYLQHGRGVVRQCLLIGLVNGVAMGLLGPAGIGAKSLWAAFFAAVQGLVLAGGLVITLRWFKRPWPALFTAYLGSRFAPGLILIATSRLTLDAHVDRFGLAYFAGAVVFMSILQIAEWIRPASASTPQAIDGRAGAPRASSAAPSRAAAAHPAIEPAARAPAVAPVSQLGAPADETLTAGPALTPGAGAETLTAGPAPTPGVGAETLTAGPTPTSEKAQAAGEIPPVSGSREWLPGDVVDGRYEVLGVIGRGGMGAVYQVRHREWQIEMAVKMPLPHLVADAPSRARFVREAQVWVDLGFHPNIVQCWYVRELDGMPRVFADYVGGGSLKEWMKSGQIAPRGWPHILDLMIQACDGLAYAHDSGVVHRDVKPANLLLADDGRLCVTDFGLVKVHGAGEIEAGGESQRVEGGQQTLTVTGSSLGTPEYGAPEQWGEAHAVDGRADVYALGVTLFELCCGRRPFDDGINREPPQVLIGRHLTSPPPDPATLAPDIPRALSAVILTCLAKDPADRPATAAELRLKLAGIHAQLVTGASPREVPRAADLRANALNNRAASLWDLGSQKEAWDSWQQALKLDPENLEAVANTSLLDWREARITDVTVLERLRALEETHATRGEFWRVLGEVELGRGDLDAAEAALETAVRNSGVDAESERLLGMVRSLRAAGEQGIRRLRTVEHRAREAAVCFSPDGEWAYFGGGDATTGGGDTSVRRWDLSTGKLDLTLRGHGEAVRSLAVSPDQTFLLSGSGDAEENLRLWRLPGGRFLRTLDGHVGGVQSIAISADGSRALSANAVVGDSSWRLWDLSTAESLLWVKVELTAGVNDMCFTPDGLQALSADSDHRLRRWDLTTGTVLQSFGGHTDKVTAVAVSSTGRLVVSGSEDATVGLWDPDTGKLRRTLRGHTGGVTSVAISADDLVVLSCGSDRTVRLWNANTGVCLRTFTDPVQPVAAVAMDVAGDRGLWTGGEGTVSLWSLRLPEHQPAIMLARVQAVLELTEEHKEAQRLSADAQRFLEAGELERALEVLGRARRIAGFEREPSLLDLWHRAAERMVRVGLTTAWQAREATGSKAPIHSLAIGREPEAILVGSGPDPEGSNTAALRQLELSSDKAVCTYDAAPRCVYCVASGADRRVAITGDKRSTMHLWGLDGGQAIRRLEGHTAAILDVDVASNGRFALSTGMDHTVRLWDLYSGNLLRTIKAHRSPVTAAKFVHDEHLALSCARDGTLRLWDLAKGKRLRTLKRKKHAPECLAVSVDGCQAVTGDVSGEILHWDLSTGECVNALYGHTSVVQALALFPDGRFALSGSFDQTVRLWDLTSGECLRALEGHADYVTALATVPGDRYCVSGSQDGTLIWWELDWELRATGDTEAAAYPSRVVGRPPRRKSSESLYDAYKIEKEHVAMAAPPTTGGPEGILPCPSCGRRVLFAGKPACPACGALYVDGRSA